MPDPVRRRVLPVLVRGQPARPHDRELRPEVAQRDDGLPAVEARHLHVDKGQVEPAGRVAEERDRLGAVGRRDTRKPKFSSVLRMMSRTDTSSSTTRMCSPLPRGSGTRSGFACSSRCVADSPADVVGRKTENVVPAPSADMKVMNPRWAFTIERAVERPSPLPRPTPFVVKNGSNIWPRRTSGMPQPVSATSNLTNSPGTASGCGLGEEGGTW